MSLPAVGFAALILVIATPNLAHYPLYGTQWMDSSFGGAFAFPWVTATLIARSTLHACVLSLLVLITEAVWRFPRSPVGDSRPWSLYAVIPAALVELAWVVLAWDLM